MNTKLLSSRALMVAALLGPVAAAIGTRFAAPVLGPSVASASSGEVLDAPVSFEASKAAPVAPDVLRLREAVALIGAPDASPFFVPKPAPEPEAIEVTQDPRAESELRSQQPRFVLTSIMSGRETVAAINGKIWRLGEDVAPGWRVAGINKEIGEVVLVHVKFGRQTLRLNEDEE